MEGVPTMVRRPLEVLERASLFCFTTKRIGSPPSHLRHAPICLLASLLLLFSAGSLPASDPQAGSIALGWEANTEPQLLGYRLYFGTASGQYDTAIDVGNVTTYTVSGLVPGTYYFALTAYSSAEETTYSNEVLAVVSISDTRAPSISAVSVAEISAAAAMIRWSTDEPADSQVEFGHEASYDCLSLLDPTLTTAHAVALAGLASGVQYHYRVRSRDAAGNSAVSVDFTFTTGLPPDTTEPFISSIQVVSVTNTSATVQWFTDEAADGQIEYGPSGDYGSTSALNSTLSLPHSQTISGLAAGTTYHYRVKSRDAAGNLAVSDDHAFRTTALPDISSGLVAAYGFDEGSGSTAADSSGNANTAILKNTSWSNNAKFGKSLSFNGNNSYVIGGIRSLPDVAGPKTIACWLYWINNKSTNQSAIIVLANEAQHASVHQGFIGGQAGVLEFGKNWLVAASVPGSKAWHHFAYTFDGDRHRFYIDGVAVSESTIPLQIAAVTSLEIGRWIEGSDYFKGNIDEVRIYNRALRPEEIPTVMESAVGNLNPSGLLSAGAASAPDPLPSGSVEDIEPESRNLHPGTTTDASSQPVLDIRMSQRIYMPGQLVSADAWWVSNPSGFDRSVEPKTWLVSPDVSAEIVAGLTSGSILTLAAGFNHNFGPVPLFQVSAQSPTGAYQLNARLIDPVTGDILATDINRFALASSEGESAGERLQRDIRRRSTGSSPYLDILYSTSGSPDSWRIENVGTSSAAVELKVWLEVPGHDPIAVLSLGQAGALVLPAASSFTTRKMALLEPAQAITGSACRLRSRLLDALTGELLYETAEPIVIR